MPISQNHQAEPNDIRFWTENSKKLSKMNGFHSDKDSTSESKTAVMYFCIVHLMKKNL